MIRFSRTFALTSAFAALLFSGCGTSNPTLADNGESAKSADAILTDATAALKGASSVHMQGTVTSSGTTVAMDFHVKNGGTGYGSMTFNGSKVEVVLTGGKAYMKGKEFFASFGGTTAADAVGDNWVVVPTDGSNSTFGSFASSFSTSSIADQFTGKAVTKDTTITIDGMPALGLKSDKGTMYVATRGPAYPLRIAPAASSGTGEINFTDYGADVSVTPPSGAIDISTLASAGAASSSPATPSSGY